MEFYAILLTLEPFLYFRALVVLGIVQDEVYFFILVPGDELVQKTLGIEPVDEPEVKFRIIADPYRSDHFQ